MVTPVERGETVPFDGMLYPIENAIRVSKRAEQCEFLLKEQEDHCQRRLAFEDKLCGQVVELHADAAREREGAIKARFPSWALVGIAYVSGILTVVIGAWTMGQVAS